MSSLKVYFGFFSSDKLCHLINAIAIYFSEQATSEFEKPSLSKWGEVHNLCCENEFYLHENEKWFPYQRLSTYPRFEIEARENPQKWPINVAYLFE